MASPRVVVAASVMALGCYGQLPVEGDSLAGSGGAAVVDVATTSDASGASGGGPEDVLGDAERALLLGDDRVADTFVAVWPALPRSLEEVETLLGVGRSCNRPLTREVFTVEEPQTRQGGENIATPAWVPRFVITGCSETIAERAELFVVAVAAPELAEASDPLARTHVELMARDRTTALFNFYELSFEGETPTLRRTVRHLGKVLERSRRIDEPLVEAEVTDAHCFSCHVQGAPLMLELSSPWAGWISEVSPQARRVYAGSTESLIEESIVGLDGVGSRAYDLQGTIERAMERLVDQGLAPTSDGLLDRSELRALLCETELNFEPRPLALFVDPDVLDGTVASVAIPTTLDLPRLVPVRSRIDRQMERSLVADGALRQSTALALRVFDDAHDIFSERRCALVDELPAEVPVDTLDASLRDLLSSRLGELEPAAGTYVETLLEVPPPPTLAAARHAYLETLVARLQAASTALESEEGRQALQARAAARVAAARAMFPGPSAPLPWFDAGPAPR